MSTPEERQSEKPDRTERVVTWQALTEGTADEVILAVDFRPDQGRTAAGFGHLAKLLPARFTVLAPDRTAWGGDGTPAEAFAAWTDSLARLDNVVAVLGFCAGCQLAKVAADLLDKPALLFFDPLPVGGMTFWYQFATAVRNLVPGLAGETVEAESDQARGWAQTTSDYAVLATRLADRYAELLDDVAGVLALDPTVVDYLSAHLRGYLRYLAIAANADPTGGLADALVVRSTDPRSAAVKVARSIEVDVPQAGLLRHDEAVSAVVNLLGVSRTGQPV